MSNNAASQVNIGCGCENGAVSCSCEDDSSIILADPASFSDGETITVSVKVTNTGKVAGKEVVQLYVADMNGTWGRPVKELKGFVKLALEPGETKTATMVLDARALSYWNEDLKDWYAPTGIYQIQVGHASDDIRLAADVAFTTEKLLPLNISSSTTLGELLKDPRTAAKAQVMISGMAAFFGDGGEADGEEASETAGKKANGEEDDADAAAGRIVDGENNNAAATGGETVESDNASSSAGSQALGDEMVAAMVLGMPLKSVATFSGGAIDLEQLLADFNSAQ
ncbi:MAG: fibronectin type III-like domain-contianing protein [Lachnospiraceae bacterium]|nr:fibronectin type III-like domain-contianing protein [Lachnospiraceae bacterium]